MIQIIGFLLSPLGRIGLAVFGVLAFLGAFALDQRHKGAAVAVAKIEKANANAVSQAHSARSSSSVGRGVRDPYATD